MLKYTPTVFYPCSLTNGCRDLLFLIFGFYTIIFLNFIYDNVHMAIHLYLLTHVV